MKNIQKILFSAFCCLVIIACVEKDEISQWNMLHDVEEKTKELEDLCYNLNNNILSIDKILEAQSNQLSINGIQQNTNGYSIFFSDGTVATIYNGKDGVNGINGKDGINGVDGKDGANGKDGINGKDGKDGVDGKDGINGKDGKDGVDGKDGSNGKDGKDGYVPEISVLKILDTYYWTIDGEVMHDNEGNMIIAQYAKGQNGVDGKDGITPKLRIEKEYWEVSYDNGVTWTQLGKATGAEGNPGITPKLEIRDGYWYISYDNGKNFEKLGKAVGEDAQKPQFKIEDGKLAVSYDGGETWEDVEGGNFAGDKIVNNDPSKSGNGIWSNHEYIDLGLPSGNKWATVNIGATLNYENGALFAFGETKWKTKYEEKEYLKQYNVECEFSYSGCVMGYGEECDPLKEYLDTCKSIAGTQYDAATTIWGEGWSIPLKSDFQELLDNCSWATATINDIKGYKITSSKPGNTNWIFLPFTTGAGGTPPKNKYSTAECAPDYTRENVCGHPDYAEFYVFVLGSFEFNDTWRFQGLPIRPVCKPKH